MKVGDFQIGNYAFQITLRLKWYINRLQGRYDFPKPALIVPMDGWIDDEKEITQALLDDPAFDVTIKRKKK